MGDCVTVKSNSIVYQWIEFRLGQAQRNLRRPAYPRDIQPLLPWDRAEGSLRRDMYSMYQEGRLVRVGGEGARQGYRLPTALERLAFMLHGQWPPFSETVMIGPD